MRLLVFALTLLLGSSPLLAKETDNLTGRYKSLEDSTAILDQEMNKRLQELAEKASKKKISCGDTQKIRILFHDLNDSTNMIGAMESWAEDNEKVPKRKASPSNSVYDGVLANGTLFNKLELGSTIKVNGELIGTDKLGHFIDQGFTYYTSFRKSGNMYASVVGIRGSERSVFGTKSTGVRSWADGMANYQGILFYHDLTEGDAPYLKCVNNQWTQITSFSFAKYVDGGWDEGINCSQIPDDTARAVYEKNIAKLETDSKLRGNERSFHCPVDIAACGKLRYRHAAYEKFLLSPECRKTKMDRSAPASNSGSTSQSSKATK